MSQDNGFFLSLRNTGSAACVLRGTPKVVASAVGQPTVIATAGRMPPFGDVANTRHGGIVAARIDVPQTCPSDPGGGNNGLAKYHSLVVSFPGGGSMRVSGLHLTFQCGMSVTPFYTPKPAQSYPPDPLAALVPRLRLPATVRPGTTMMYEIELVNPTSRAVPLSPCPVYLEHSSIPTKLFYRLNCSQIRSVPANGSVRYEMEMAIPASAQPGLATVFWALDGSGTRSASGTVKVR